MQKKPTEKKKTTEKEEKIEQTPETEETQEVDVDVSIEDGEIEKLKKELDAQKDLALRTVAEFDNFKKRTEREKLASREFMKADMVKTFLPVLDNFSLALGADPKSDDFLKGLEMIKKSLTDAMVTLGLSEINGEGEEFDPALHQAVLHIDDENYGENIIVKTLQKGYKIGDTVIRPAMVQVAN